MNTETKTLKSEAYILHKVFHLTALQSIKNVPLFKKTEIFRNYLT